MKTKQCSKCKEILNVNYFYKSKYRKCGYKSQCKKCHGISAHTNRKYNNLEFLNGVYRHMKDRVDGSHYKSKFMNYKGKSILDKNIFIEWSLNNDSFNRLFKEYINCGFIFKYCPSIDRINSLRGYDLDNMQWITVQENGRKGMVEDRALRICFKGQSVEI